MIGFKTHNKVSEGKELTISNLIDEIGKLENDKELMNEKLEDKDKLLDKITQDNALMSNRIEELEGDINEYERVGQDLGIREQLKDYYNEGLLQMSLDKTTEERTIYKETIKKMCGKFNINHSDVCKIIDQVKTERENKQREL